MIICFTRESDFKEKIDTAHYQKRQCENIWKRTYFILGPCHCWSNRQQGIDKGGNMQWLLATVFRHLKKNWKTQYAMNRDCRSPPLVEKYYRLCSLALAYEWDIAITKVFSPEATSFEIISVRVYNLSLQNCVCARNVHRRHVAQTATWPRRQRAHSSSK